MSVVGSVPPEWEAFDPEAHADLVIVAAGPGRPSLAPQAKVTMAPPPKVNLYRYFDSSGRLLYAGITEDLGYRAVLHRRGSAWMDLAAGSQIVHFETRAEAEQAEAAAIKAEQPLFNKVHNDTPQARARLVAYLVRENRLDLLPVSKATGVEDGRWG